ncbi:radical SAM protein [archaeon]|nr:MAG: radical SAM protein [archaeon]
MKVLLLNPPFLPKFSRQSRSPCVTKGGTFYFPYFLSYCAGAVEKAGFETKLADAVADCWNKEQTVQFAKEFNPELIVIDTSTPSIVNDMEVADELKDALPNSHITLVGTHPTALPEETLKNCKADSVCRGEYDYTVRDLAIALKEQGQLKTVEGLSFKHNSKTIHNEKRELIKNLDELPFVSEVFLKHFGKEGIKKYFYASLRWPQTTLLTARGCPYSCFFCNSPLKHSYRPRSVENVIAELEFIQKEMPFVKEIMFEDETFPAVKDRTIKLCDEIAKRKIKLKWSCNARVNTDLETLKSMKRAGCRLMCVGFEASEQEVLDSIDKKTTKDMQLEFMKNSRKAGILVNGCFIFGLPSDTKETMRRTLEFAKQLNCDTSQFYPLMVYPGTASYEWAKKNNFLETEDYSKWLTPDGQMTTTLSRPGMSRDELLAFCDLARKEYYMRAGYIVPKVFQSIRNPQEGLRTLKAAKTFFRHLK